MNKKILFQKMTHILHTFICVFDNDFEQKTEYKRINQKRAYPYETDFVNNFLLKDHFSKCKNEISECPMLKSVNKEFYYAVIYAKTEKEYYALGPVFLYEPLGVIDNITYDIPYDKETEQIKKVFTENFLEEVVFLYNLFSENEITISDLLKRNTYGENPGWDAMKISIETMFYHNENLTRHNPYDQELREQHAIECGEPEQLKISIEEDYSGMIGTLSKDAIRQVKNNGIVVITLASRSAIRGGLAPEVSFALSDGFIQKIEELDNPAEIMILIRKAEFEYARLVQSKKNHIELQNKKHPKIEMCKEYILLHLNDRITVELLAQEVKCNPNYLSQLFKKYEGITISHYILIEKINRAKNLLVYSDYSYIEIAAYLNFASQSHLGQHFKRITNYTLQEYRYTFGVRNKESCFIDIKM